MCQEPGHIVADQMRRKQFCTRAAFSARARKLRCNGMVQIVTTVLSISAPVVRKSGKATSAESPLDCVRSGWRCSVVSWSCPSALLVVSMGNGHAVSGVCSCFGPRDKKLSEVLWRSKNLSHAAGPSDNASKVSVPIEVSISYLCDE